MKILLDVCTPVQVRLAPSGQEVWTAQKMGWGDLENGTLLAAAEAAGFDVFVICDKNLRYQQKPRRPTPRDFGVVDESPADVGKAFRPRR